VENLKHGTTEQRKKVAHQIVWARWAERNLRFKTRRTVEQYSLDIPILLPILDFYMAHGLTRNVLDLGAGDQLRAVTQLGSMNEYSSLHFLATVLRYRRSFLNSTVPVHATSAEMLREFPDDSLDVIIGVHSISYSVAPELVAMRLFKALSGGGLVVASCKYKYDRNTREKTATQLEQSFVNSGFDVQVLKLHPKTKIEHDILLARKPSFIKSFDPNINIFSYLSLIRSRSNPTG